jgi:hypothetical protein
MLTHLFAHAHQELRAAARHEAGGAAPLPQTYGTTLLVGLETETDLVAGYAGNGAIWHIRGNFDDFPSTTLPWNAVNLLNPHTLPRDGREVLYNIVDAADESPPVPSIVSVGKDPRFGDILLLCTDGVYSADQVTHGTDSGGRLWIGAEPAMLAFHQALRELFDGWDGEATPALREALEAWLLDLRARGLLEDDATVGVIVTADALRYQRRARLARDTPTAGRGIGGAEAPSHASAKATRSENTAEGDGRGAGEEGRELADLTHAGAAAKEA